MMKIVQVNNGEYAIRKFSLSKLSWVYLDLDYAFSYTQGTLASLSGVTMWRNRTNIHFQDCFSTDFEKVYHIYKRFPQCIKEKNQDPYEVVKVYNEEELKQHQMVTKQPIRK
jgi:hypothetical protein